MNFRQAIQPSTTPKVLSLSISSSRRRLVAGLTDGFRIFRMDNCLTTCQPNMADGVSIAAALDDRFSAYVSTHRLQELSGPTVVVFWDSVLERELSRHDFHEPVLGLRLTSKWMAVVLAERTILFQYQDIRNDSLSKKPADGTEFDLPYENDVTDAAEVLRAPNLVHSLHQTSPNPLALACLTDDLLVLPAQSLGQVQVVSLNPDGSTTKRVVRAHNSALRCVSLSQDGSLIATASEQGTLVRIYGSRALDLVAEFRRGMDHALIFNLAFSPGNRWVASTSDKGTLHIFDIRPSDPAAVSAARDRETKHRKTSSYAGHRLSGANYDKDSASGTSVGRSSPAPSSAIGGGPGTGYHGSAQEYYGLRPPPSSATPPPNTGISALAALKSSPLAPRIFKDSRSAASAPFHTGNEPPHWQGGPAHSWTTTPNGTRKKVKNPILPLPSDPTGRPPKGIITFAPAGDGFNDDDGAVLYVIGGGSDPRWEKFELVPTTTAEAGVGGGWALVNRGFRKYLTRQFAD